MNDQIIIFHRFHLSDSKAFVCPKTTRDTITPPTILSNSATVKDSPRQWPLKFLCLRTKIRRILVNEKTQPPPPPPPAPCLGGAGAAPRESARAAGLPTARGQKISPSNSLNFCP